MNIINKKLSKEEFIEYVKAYNFTRSIHKLVLHHTYIPTLKTWKGEDTILAMKRYYERKKWSAGPHIYVANDIWLFTDFNTQGIHAGRGNYRSIGIEMIGNYWHKKPQEKVLENTISVLKILEEKLGLDLREDLYFHRDFAFKLSGCPGWAISKKWILNLLKNKKMLKIIREKNRNEIYAVINQKKYYIGGEAFKDLLAEKLVSWSDVEVVDGQINLDGIIK